MPNSNYARGRAREYQVMHSLRSKGWVCSRSAMSHGPVDIFAAKAGRILLIQVKSGSARVKKEELKLLKSFALAFKAEAQVWSFKSRGKCKKITVMTRNGTAKRLHQQTGTVPRCSPVPKHPICRSATLAPASDPPSPAKILTPATATTSAAVVTSPQIF